MAIRKLQCEEPNLNLKPFLTSGPFPSRIICGRDESRIFKKKGITGVNCKVSLLYNFYSF